MAAWLGGGGRDSSGVGDKKESQGWTPAGGLAQGCLPPPTDSASPQSWAGHRVGSTYFLVSWFLEAH